MKHRSYRTTRAAAAISAVGSLLILAGCHNRPVVAPLPAVQTPVSIEDTHTKPDDGLLLEPVPVKLPPTPVAAAAAKPRREKKRVRPVTTPPVETPPTQVAATPAPPAPAPALAIGSLTAGGSSSPQTVQDATDLLNSIEKRLNALPSDKAEEQRTQINKIKNFWRDAQAALKTGDGEGAMTLATKAKLLLDDLEK